jgi:hypothetical protein
MELRDFHFIKTEPFHATVHSPNNSTGGSSASTQLVTPVPQLLSQKNIFFECIASDGTMGLVSAKDGTHISQIFQAKPFATRRSTAAIGNLEESPALFRAARLRLGGSSALAPPWHRIVVVA